MSGGVGVALGQVLGDGSGDLPEAEAFVQAALFDDLDETETGRLDVPSPLSAALATPKSGPGRRKGSRNRRTEAVTQWLLSQHRHPLSVMAEAYSMAPADLAARIGLRKAVKITKTMLADGSFAEEEVATDYYANDTLLEIVKLQLRMAEAVAPYVAQRQPLAVQANLKGNVTMSFEGVSFPARGGSPAAGDREDAIEGEVLAVRLGVKSDDESRTDT